MANQSKIQSDQNLLQNILKSLTKTPSRKVMTLAAVVTLLYLGKQGLTQQKETLSPQTKQKFEKDRKKKSKGHVNKEFFLKLKKLLKIVFPKWNDISVFYIIMLTVSLYVRSKLSIYIASINGQIVKSIVGRNLKEFITRILALGSVAVPASFLNSYLDFLNKSLSIEFRAKLTEYFNGQYLNDMIFYQLTNLDSRVQNPEQTMTSDIEKWSNSLSLIYGNFTKPILDIILLTNKLVSNIGALAPGLILAWYLVSGVVMKFISPAFGKLTAISQTLEGQYRACHTDLLKFSEEIAFYDGREWERKRIDHAFKNLMSHQKVDMQKRLFMGTFDSILTKYGNVLLGYSILGLPVFGPGREEYKKLHGGDQTKITQDYIRNSSLLINFAKAIGRLAISYKEIQQLAGYTVLVSQMREVLSDLNKGQYERQQVNAKSEYGIQHNDRENQLIKLQQGKIVEVDDYIQFEKLPIVTPNGDKLVIDMDITIKRGMNVVISGPNGCGKSSLFRILGGLWPILGGTLKRPSMDKLFYVPQRPYLPDGNLRDQIIYPHTKLDMLRRGYNDNKLIELMKKVQLDSLLTRGNLDIRKDWTNQLAMGEKQAIAMARLFYHKPLFAILDECTSSVSLELEATLYETAKELNITLFTVSHRTSLFKYHEYILKFNGKGAWTFEEFTQ
ncbi:P-loop containing nucleoside triphosphate hydrolase [Pseudocohnilembus persalinus]|uniref:p-loop containing nucleoside triphosphate hydrolase n=1 Tax=Pseudocohnilembus persalinus TaxID=266149 RepID=A0A0V0R5C9_PSEPJ|nr:P-loop containing nucleoside triphosphate hydrolase [Pseudocohnilembus persalinus]|eukprot:KRX09691.1 P-loop containing nucleoside triphosphate hydrolase [Pseudocohnilembus persalinus]